MKKGKHPEEQIIGVLKQVEAGRTVKEVARECVHDSGRHSRDYSPYPVRCTIEGVKIPADVRAAMTEIARMFGRQGGKASARNMTPEERSARAQKASLAAAEVRTAKRLAREGVRRDRQAARRKRAGQAT